MNPIYTAGQNTLIAEGYFSKVEEIPTYAVKTPLQSVVQLLKQHRDVMFEDNPDVKPISIIITTLAAKAYNNETNLADAFINIINGMERYLEENEKGKFVVSNPVNPLENFADKWEEESEKEVAFFEWIEQLKKDYSEISSLSLSFTSKKDTYEAMFGRTLKDESPTFSISKQLNLSHRNSPLWAMNLQEECEVVCYKGRVKNRRIKIKSGEPLNKNWQLTFEVKTNVSLPFETHWRVANSGQEAEDNNCLRGEFYKEEVIKGKKVRTETTAYSGEHSVECFIVKNGICVAKSKEFIVNIS